MTFKNVKFSDSAVMRSLEKLAVKKGLIKPDEIKKEASVVKTSTLKPTGDLIQDLLKLCEGLRKSGFSKYADDVETKFIQFKQASKETGDQFINDAHPEGSVKLKNMEGDATVENILDIKKKIEDIVKKTPKGKLANQDYINLVKITLGQQTNNGPLSTISEQLAKGREIWERIDSELEANTNKGILPASHHWSDNYNWNTISGYIKTNLNRKPEDMTTDRIERLFSDINKAYKFIINLGKEDLVNRIEKTFHQLFFLYKPMRTARDEYNSNQSSQLSGKTVSENSQAKPYTLPEVVVTQGGTVETQTEGLLSKVKSFKAQVNADMELTDDERNSALTFLNKKVLELNAQKAGFIEVPDTEKMAAQPKFLKNLGKIETQLQQFYTNWIA